MKKIFALLLILSVCGCTLSDISRVNAHKELPIDLGNRKGRACGVLPLGFLGMLGDNSLSAAARNGGIKTVTYYEHDYSYYLIIGESCTNVYGYGAENLQGRRTY